MEEEVKKLLKKNLEVSEETLRIIRKIHRAQSVGRFLKVFKWLIVIALSLGFYYYVQPYFDIFWQTLGDLQKDFSALKDLPFPPR